MTLRSALLASAMIALPVAAANAQAIDGLYVGAGVGVNFKQSQTIQSRVGAVTTSRSVNANAGPAGVLSLGWGFGNGLRAEIEGSLRHNTFQNAGGVNEILAGGMVNVLYDFVGVLPAVQPYVGGGIGYQNATYNGFNSVSSNNAGSLAFQAIVGAAFPIAAVPGLALTAEYRFLTLVGDRTYTGTGPATGTSFKATNDFNHSLLVGVRYAFGVAAAPMTMPMADVGAKSFQVFFDWNKADITSAGLGVIRNAAEYSTKTRYTRIDVDGNTDSSGTPGYNLGLSERRARAVAATLVQQGVPQSAISMHAYGESRPLVPTGPNTREPQNRRVEIVYR